MTSDTPFVPHEENQKSRRDELVEQDGRAHNLIFTCGEFIVVFGVVFLGSILYVLRYPQVFPWSAVGLFLALGSLYLMASAGYTMVEAYHERARCDALLGVRC